MGSPRAVCGPEIFFRSHDASSKMRTVDGEALSLRSKNLEYIRSVLSTIEPSAHKKISKGLSPDSNTAGERAFSALRQLRASTPRYLRMTESIESNHNQSNESSSIE
mmetsp:Transcript_21422/g.47835  ORF Transcript_21422/g.47835 Transcript_21422/m.47835 type:complete len:107 (-) Transcript_21422:603-923(-)